MRNDINQLSSGFLLEAAAHGWSIGWSLRRATVRCFDNDPVMPKYIITGVFVKSNGDRSFIANSIHHGISLAVKYINSGRFKEVSLRNWNMSEIENSE